MKKRVEEVEECRNYINHVSDEEAIIRLLEEIAMSLALIADKMEGAE